MPSFKTASEKTFKREVAVALLVFLLGLVVSGFFVDAGQREYVTTMVDQLRWPVFTYAGAAFGMDWAKKQTNFGGAPDHLPFDEVME